MNCEEGSSAHKIHTRSPPPHPRSQQLNSSHTRQCYCCCYSQQVAFVSPFPGSDQVPRRLSVLTPSVPFSHQDVAPQHLWGRTHTHTVLHCVNTPDRDGIRVKTLTCPPQNGDVCISILHPPVDDPQSGELPSERWNPTQNVRYLSSLHSFKCCDKFRVMINKLAARLNLQEFSNDSVWLCGGDLVCFH